MLMCFTLCGVVFIFNWSDLISESISISLYFSCRFLFSLVSSTYLSAGFILWMQQDISNLM